MRRELIDYFTTPEWTTPLSVMVRGRSIRHAHVCTEGNVHPISMSRSIEIYFSECDLPLERKIKRQSLATT